MRFTIKIFLTKKIYKKILDSKSRWFHIPVSNWSAILWNWHEHEIFTKMLVWIYGMHTLFTDTHTHTHRQADTLVLCPSHWFLPCSALRGSTLLNCILHPIDYFNGVSCYTVGSCMRTPHQNHTQSPGRRIDAVSSSFPEPCVLVLHDQKWQRLNIAIASLHQAGIITILSS